MFCCIKYENELLRCPKEFHQSWNEAAKESPALSRKLLKYYHMDDTGYQFIKNERPGT